MARIPKSHKGAGYGRQEKRGKKTLVQKQVEQAGRNIRAIIESRIRTNNPGATEVQIRNAVRMEMDRLKKPKSSS